jgi:hypothetical protein
VSLRQHHAAIPSATFIEDFVTELTTMPWGNRSLLFRDPDGYLRPLTIAAAQCHPPALRLTCTCRSGDGMALRRSARSRSGTGGRARGMPRGAGRARSRLGHQPACGGARRGAR